MADLQGRALDAAVAKQLFGWKHFKFSSGLVLFLSPSSAANECIASRNPEEVESGCENDAPPFSTSHDAVAKVRAEIERRGLERQFLSEMIAIVGYTEWTAWRSMNASPEQQCRAALRAVEGAHA